MLCSGSTADFDSVSRGSIPFTRAIYEHIVYVNRGSVVDSVFLYGKILESNAAGMVRRPALKTGFSEMGWGSTPLLSANL